MTQLLGGSLKEGTKFDGVFFPGDFIPVEEPKEDKSKKRVVREDGAGDGSDEDDDRIDMAAITGAKEREERREQFYSVQREGRTHLITRRD